MLRSIVRLWRRREDVFPVLVRVSDARGRPCSAIRIEGIWQPSGRRFSVMPIVADGLCLLPWRGSERRLEAKVIVGDKSCALALDRDRREPHRAHDVRVG
jgi:hypothetical protein